MNLESLFPKGLGLSSVELAGAILAGLVLIIAFASRFRGEAKVHPAPKPRPISIETEVSMDVKKRWKNTFKKQPFSGR